MDPAADVESLVPSDSQFRGGEVKRPVESDEELGVRVAKKPRCGERDLKRVAEIVLVLSTMAGMRAARSPTAVEVGMMAEARAKLAEVCQSLAPKEIVGREAVERVIEDLGLNWKAKDQRLGSRTSKLSISEKLEVTMRKMEESRKFAVASVTCNSHSLQTRIGAAAESCMTPNAVHTLSDKPSLAPFSSGGFPLSSPLAHVSGATSSSLPYQLSNSDERASMVSSGLSASHIVKSSSLAVPRVERTQFKLDGGSNGSSFGPQVQANSSANHPLVNAPTWSIQSQSISSAKTGLENKVHNSAKVEGTADSSMSQMAPQAARDQTFRPFITQTASGNFPSMHQPLQPMNFVPAPRPVFNHHREIAKIVQKLLQPQLPEHPTWTPPSRDYMSKPSTCQACKLIIIEVESVLLCDACDKGYHLKCLQSYNQKGIPRGEWHCINCLTLSAGKPLPPKYGRVTRNTNAPKLPSNVAGVQSFSDKKVENSYLKVDEQKIIANGSSGLQSPACSDSMGNNYVESTSDLRVTNASEVQGNKISSSRNNMDEKCDNQDVAQVTPTGSSGISTGAGGLAGFSSDGLYGVKWISDILKVADGKKYYESCFVNGVTYRVQDYALFRSSHDKLIPSKLQAMWEDSNTGSKWVIINRCYFPGDLPEIVNRPCTPESNEVYGSNQDTNVMVGLIEGPCEVLPPAKFKEESERRSQLETEANNGLLPIFLCKWFYDEFKGLFQPVSS